MNISDETENPQSIINISECSVCGRIRKLKEILIELSEEAWGVSEDEGYGMLIVVRKIDKELNLNLNI